MQIACSFPTAGQQKTLLHDMMVGFTCFFHGELAPCLIKHPQVFGLYDSRFEKQQDGDYHVPVVVSKPEKTLPTLRSTIPPSPFKCPTASESRFPSAEIMFGGAALLKLSTATETDTVADTDDWFFKGDEQGFGTRSCTLHRRKAVRISKVEPRHHSRTPDIPYPQPKGYDLTRLDRLLENLTEQVGACSTHIQAETDGPSTPLPRVISEPLTSLHAYLDSTTALYSILPLASTSSTSWVASNRIFSTIKLLQGSADDEIRRKEAHFRALRALRLLVAPEKSCLVYSLMAVMTAQTALLYIHSFLSTIIRLRCSSRIPHSRREVTSSPFAHHGSRKARTILGLNIASSIPLRPWFELPCHDIPSSTTTSSQSAITASSTHSSWSLFRHSSQSCSVASTTTASPMTTPMKQNIHDPPSYRYSFLLTSQELNLLQRKRLVALLQIELNRLVKLLARLAGVRPLVARKVMEAKGFFPDTQMLNHAGTVRKDRGTSGKTKPAVSRGTAN